MLQAARSECGSSARDRLARPPRPQLNVPPLPAPPPPLHRPSLPEQKREYGPRQTGPKLPKMPALQDFQFFNTQAGYMRAGCGQGVGVG